MKKVTMSCDICGAKIEVLVPISIKGKTNDIYFNYKDICASCTSKILAIIFQIQADSKAIPESERTKGWKQYLEKECSSKHTAQSIDCMYFDEELGCHQCKERFRSINKIIKQQ